MSPDFSTGFEHPNAFTSPENVGKDWQSEVLEGGDALFPTYITYFALRASSAITVAALRPSTPIF
jgi:hypothetical protein